MNIPQHMSLLRVLVLAAIILYVPSCSTNQPGGQALEELKTGCKKMGPECQALFFKGFHDRYTQYKNCLPTKNEALCNMALDEIYGHFKSYVGVEVQGWTGVIREVKDSPVAVDCVVKKEECCGFTLVMHVKFSKLTREDLAKKMASREYRAGLPVRFSGTIDGYILGTSITWVEDFVNVAERDIKMWITEYFKKKPQPELLKNNINVILSGERVEIVK